MGSWCDLSCNEFPELESSRMFVAGGWHRVIAAGLA